MSRGLEGEVRLANEQGTTSSQSEGDPSGRHGERTRAATEKCHAKGADEEEVRDVHGS